MTRSMATGLYIAMVFHPNLHSGVAEHTHQMARHLTELGEDITVLTPALPGSADFDRTCGYPVVRFDTRLPTGKWLKTLMDRRLILWGMLKQVYQLKPDYIILDMWGPLASISAALVSKVYNIPLFLFAHGPDLNQPRYKKFIRKIVLAAATQIICVSDYTRSFLLDWGVDPVKLVTIHNGFDLREIEYYRTRNYQGRFPRVDSAFPEESSTVLTVSRLVPLKRVHRVIEAMPRVITKFPEARYTIVGDGTYRAYLEALALASPAKDSITFLGPMSGDEKFECLSRCDVFVMPSEGEGFGIAFIEAMGFGKPIIGGRSGGTKEAIVHGQNGLLVDSDDVEEIANTIVELLEDPKRARELGENGRKQVESELNWKTSASKFLSVVREILDECN